jgi:outer membrane protein assembly factor BamB
VLLLVSVSAGAVAHDRPGTAANDQAREILLAAGVTGGLVVHLGCGDGKLTAALRAGDAYTVQGLDADPKNVEAARQYIESIGLYGSVSVQPLTGGHLPYVDNLVRLLVAEDLGGVPMVEVMRVVAPLGVAYVKQGGAWTKTVKPWPKDMDEWQQHFHGADNNAVAHDRLVGPPRRYQWIAYPEWTRSHLTLPSITSFVSSKGRLFTIEDQGSAEHPALPGEFTLVARDAFSGIVLWQRRFPDWWPVNVYIKFTPVQIQRRLAAVGDTVYATTGYSAPVTAMEAATGKVLKTYEGTGRTTEFVYDGGVLFVVVGDPTDTAGIGDPKGGLGSSQFARRAYGPEIPKLAKPVSTILAIDTDTGRTLWKKSGADTDGYEGSSLAVTGSRVVYATATGLVCMDRVSGERIWRAAAPVRLSGPPGIAVSLVLSDTAAYLADAGGLRVFSMTDGSELWTGKAGMNHHKAPDVFLTGGVLWTDASGGNQTGARAANEPGRKTPGQDVGGLVGHDPLTGRIVKTLSQKMNGPMGHDRCYRNRITDCYYINTKTGGSDFLGLEKPGEFASPWARSTCGIGHLPCNGLLYLGPPACSCCNWVMLNAMNALAPEPGLKSAGQAPEVAVSPRLDKGPAYGQVASGQLAVAGDDWPTYRHDAGRTGVTRATAPGGLKPIWQAKVTTRASAPVIAGGKVFVADIDAHAVCAFDAADGKPLWRFTTGGRVDSPPTWHDGMILLGSHDGWAYALRAADGALAWKFRALPDDRMICAYGQVESAWPVCGSIMVADGVAYFAAGRNSFLDGGIFMFGLDPKTGRVIHQRHMYGPYNEEGYPIIATQFTSGIGLDGFKNDMFLTDGKLLYLRQQAFQGDLTPLKPAEPRPPHLIPSPGFLEAIPHHRTFWTIDTAIRYDIPTGLGAVHGDILVMDGSRFYEVRGYQPGRAAWFDPRSNGYTLYAGELSAPAGATPKEQPVPDAVEAMAARKAGKNAAAKAGTNAGAKAGRKAGPRPGSSVKASQLWSSNIPLTGKAMVLAGKTVFVAGTPVAFPEDDLAKAYEGRMGGVLWAASAETGQKLAEVKLDSPPAWDSLAVAGGRLFIILQDGRVVCIGAK